MALLLTFSLLASDSVSTQLGTEETWGDSEGAGPLPGVVALDGDDSRVGADDDRVAGRAGVVVDERAVDEGIWRHLGRESAQSWQRGTETSPLPPIRPELSLSIGKCKKKNK